LAFLLPWRSSSRPPFMADSARPKYLAFALTCLAQSVALGLAQPAQADEATRLFTDIYNMPLPAVALVDDSAALSLNPGGAGAKDLFEIYLSKSIDPTVRGHFSAFLGL